MKINDYTKIVGLTIVLDIALVYIISQCKLVVFDKSFIVCVLLTHILFYYALYYDIDPLIDSLHQILFFFLSVSIFVKNIWLLLLNLFLITTIQILWIIEERCILNKEHKRFGYDKPLSIVTLIWTILLSMKIGYTFYFQESGV